MSTRTRGAVAVLAVLGAGCAGDAQQAALPAEETSSASPPSPTGTTTGGLVAWVDGLPVGPPPEVGYVIGHTYHSADGRTIRLPRDRGYTAIARLGDGYLAVDDRSFEATVGVALLDDRGRRVRELGSMTGAPVLSRDGTTLRWITFTPSEVGPEREPTRLHVADVRTGEIRSRVIHRPGEIRPRVAPRTERYPRLDLPSRRIRRAVWSRAWEDDRHLLVGVGRAHEAAILRLDVRAGTWELTVDWTPTERSFNVVFETRP